MQPRGSWNPKARDHGEAFAKRWRRARCSWAAPSGRSWESSFPQGEQRTQRSQARIPCLLEKTEVCGLAEGASLPLRGLQRAGEGGLNKYHTARQLCGVLRGRGLREGLHRAEPSVASLHGLEWYICRSNKVTHEIRVLGELLLGWTWMTLLSYCCIHTKLFHCWFSKHSFSIEQSQRKTHGII